MSVGTSLIVPSIFSVSKYGRPCIWVGSFTVTLEVTFKYLSRTSSEILVRSKMPMLSSSPKICRTRTLISRNSITKGIYFKTPKKATVRTWDNLILVGGVASSTLLKWIDNRRTLSANLIVACEWSIAIIKFSSIDLYVTKLSTIW
ncbi:Os11g0684400 [Oryza sativa Japonica Group]|uniref:Os11g0684400 protein n=1 Tax=Oryza sativa subsp. japonica TaxID=39947 RepID=A0A0N7KTC9_ORYSJ|nr:Os11g0684400 [Oryza sativa Japonica Group]